MPIQLSGSLVITGSITTTGVITMSGSIASASYSSTSDLLQGTGSVGFTTTASFNAVSSSQQQISASYIALSASYNTFSGSASTRITVNSSSIQQVSSSQQQISASLLNVIAIGATTGSNSFRATQSITGSLTVTGQIIAQTLNVQQVTSSIIYSSGSNNFGCDLNSRQTFTGSVLITGSLTIAGASSATSYSGATIFGSTIACSPIGCFATSCATSFIGGTMSGTTIYGSTAVCSAVGKFTSCIDACTGNFTGNLSINKTSALLYLGNSTNNSYGALQFLGNASGQSNTLGELDFYNKITGVDVLSGQIEIYHDGTSCDNKAAMLFRVHNGTSLLTPLTIASTGAATFSSTITGTTIYGSTAVCSPVGKFTTCLVLGGALTGTSATFNHNDAPTIRVQRNGGTDSNTVIEFTNASCSFYIGSNGTVMGLGGTTGAIGSQPLQIASTGAATFASGIGIGGATATTGGIQFPATAVAIADANNLDDYEEGTWTPTYTGTNITISSYGNRSGYYTKVGRLVTLTFSIMTEAVSVVGSEYVNIGGLPFASANVTENANAVVIFDNSRWVSTPPVVGYVGVGTSTIALNSNIGNTGAGQDPTRVMSSNMATGAGNRNMVRANVTYFTA